MGETGDGNDGGGHNIVKLKILENPEIASKQATEMGENLSS